MPGEKNRRGLKAWRTGTVSRLKRSWIWSCTELKARQPISARHLWNLQRQRWDWNLEMFKILTVMSQFSWNWTNRNTLKQQLYKLVLYGMKKMAAVFLWVYQWSCSSCEWVGKTTFLSPAPVWVCDRGELTLITGGLCLPYCPLPV